MNIQQAIGSVLENNDLSRDEMHAVMRQIMTGEATPAQIGGFLIGLRMKGETVDEIAAAAQVMRELSTKVAINADSLVDTCGTGGDASGSFNISTASAIVAAAAGAKVAKHGNRSVSSKSGSADVLEAAGVNLSLSAEQVASSVEQCGVGFMFAPNHHSAMKHAIGPRKEMGVRTVFNVLGPLTNPAGALNQVMGVFDAKLCRPIAEVLQQLGSRHVMVVRSDDGMDEISIAAPTQVAELKDGVITEYTIHPEDFDLQRSSLDDIKVETAADSLAMIQWLLDGKEGAAADIVALNAGAAVYVSGNADSFSAGVAKAKEVLASGAAKRKLVELVDISKGL